MRKLTSREKEVVKEVLQNFDYKRVRKVMNKLKWVWYCSGTTKTPNKKTIKEFSKTLLKTCLIREITISSGGLEASLEDGFLELKFVPVVYMVEV